MRRWGWLFPVVLMVGLMAGTAVAQSDTIQACVNPSGSIFIVDDSSECGANETSLALSGPGGPSATTTYYTVETSVASPEIPASPGEAINWIPEGTEFNCEPGDVAVDLSHWSTNTEYRWTGTNPPGPGTETYGAPGEDPIIPNIHSAGDAPNGFIAKRDIPAGAHHFIGMDDDHYAATSVRHFAVTCTDLTP